MGFAMSVEKRGVGEELSAESSSAELSPAEKPEPVDIVDTTSEDTAAVKETEAAAPIETDNSTNTAETSVDATAEAESAAAEESELAIEHGQLAEVTTVDGATEESATGETTAEQGAEPAEALAEATTPADESDTQPLEEETKKEPPAEEQSRFKRGQIHSGVISSTKPTAVYVDLGEGDQGIVPGRELELMTRKTLESLVVGAEVDVYVVNPRNHRGETILSIITRWKNLTGAMPRTSPNRKKSTRR